MASKGGVLVLVCVTLAMLGSLSGAAAQNNASAPASAPAAAPAGPVTTLATPPLSQICPGSLNVSIAGASIVESPFPFTGVPGSWKGLNGQEALAVGGNGSYIAVTNRQQAEDGVSLGVTNMQIGQFYKVGAYIKIVGSAAKEKIRFRFNINDADFKCAAIVSVVQSDCYTLVLGGITGPSNDGALSDVKLEITGNALPGQTINSTSPPFEIDIFSVAAVPVDRATWLADVRNRTNLARRRDVLIQVVDSAGNPVPNATVVINQTQQTFPFGSDLNDDAYNDTDYRNWFASKWGGGYSWTAYTAALKWYAMEPDRGNVTYTRVTNIQNWCNNNSIAVRGHTVFWDDEGTIQQWIKEIEDKELLFNLMQKRVNDVVVPFAPTLEQWDPANEILHKHFFNDKLGYDVRPWYYSATRARDPTATLFLSDYNMIESCDDSTVWPEAAMDFVSFLRQQGGPVDAFAVQGQFTQVTPYIFRYGLDKLGQLGLPIWMSEINLRLTVDPYTEQTQRDLLEIILREAYAHPAVKALLLSQTWTPQRDWDGNNGTCPGDKCLYNLDFSPRPVGQMWEDLYYREWRTLNVTGTTDGNGQFGFRGFNGKYTIVVNKTGNATYDYQSSTEFIVHPVNTTTDPSTYLLEASGPYATFLNGSVAPNGTVPRTNVTSVSAATPFYNVSQTLDVTTPFLNIGQGTDNLGSKLAHFERPPPVNGSAGNASNYRLVPGSAQQVVRIVAPLTPIGRYPVSTIPVPTFAPVALNASALAPSAGSPSTSPPSTGSPSTGSPSTGSPSTGSPSPSASPQSSAGPGPA